MKKLSFVAVSSILIIIIQFSSCTTIPISFYSSLPDNRLLGVWQQNDGHAYLVYQANGATYSQQYDWNSTQRKRVLSGVIHPLYFTTLSDNSGTINFISAGEKAFELVSKWGTPKKYNYAHYKFYFNYQNQLVITEISETNLQKYDQSYLSSTDRFQYLVKAKMREPSFFGTTKVLSKKEPFEE